MVVGYWLIPRRFGRWWLLLASLLFYASWNALYVPGFVALVVLNFGFGLLAAGGRRKQALILALVVDLGLLGVFKYLDWLLGSSASIITLLTGAEVELGVLGLVLPLAISFVTFTFVAYVVDVYRGAAPERSLLRFSLFVTFFPHLIAGPIMRGHEFLPQVHHPRPFRLSYVELAAPLLIGGLLKKSIADQMLPIVQSGMDGPGDYSSLALIAIAVLFTFQLYLDFSGYTDMALGSAWLLGFRLPRNFDWPYRSLSMAEFWSRWHITLGRWLRDYIYFPMGGSRKGDRRAYLNLMVTMTLCGLWHGAGLTFIVWGALQGVALCVNRWWKRLPGARALPVLLAWTLTFAFVVVVRVFFVAPDMEAALRYLEGMFIPHGGTMPSLLLLAVLAAGIAAQWPGWSRHFHRLLPARSTQRWLAYGAAATLAVVLLPVTTPAFIYFQF